MVYPYQPILIQTHTAPMLIHANILKASHGAAAAQNARNCADTEQEIQLIFISNVRMGGNMVSVTWILMQEELV